MNQLFAVWLRRDDFDWSAGWFVFQGSISNSGFLPWFVDRETPDFLYNEWLLNLIPGGVSEDQEVTWGVAGVSLNLELYKKYSFMVQQ